MLNFDKYGMNEKRQRYFENHSLKPVFMENEEVERELKDERKYGNISFVEFLDKLENGSINASELGNLM